MFVKYKPIYYFQKIVTKTALSHVICPLCLLWVMRNTRKTIQTVFIFLGLLRDMVMMWHPGPVSGRQ
jgi:hypothetical protein